MATRAQEWKRQLIAEGRAEGRAEGEAKGKADTLLRLIARRIQLAPEVEARVRCADCAQLDGWIERFVDASSLGDVFGDVAH